MRTMSAYQMVVRACLPGELREAEAIFLQTYHEKTDWIREGVKNGLYRANTLDANGTALYVIVWHKNDQSMMHVNALAQLNGGGDFAFLMQGMKTLAKEYACQAIQGITVRAGLVKKLCEHGFRPLGVTMLCQL
jgi:hypothetical protein